MKKLLSIVGFFITIVIVFLFSTSYAEAQVLYKVETIKEQVGYTYTKYPIVLVGGILDYDMWDYFNGVEYEIEKNATVTKQKQYCYRNWWKGGAIECRKWWEVEKRQQVHFIMLSPLQETKSRGEELALEIVKYLGQLSQEAKLTGEEAPKKVNIIAHSHGATTARVAVAQDMLQGKIGSLTTIAGPHFGTASADAATIPQMDTIFINADLNKNIHFIFGMFGINLDNLQLEEGEISSIDFIYALFNFGGNLVNGLTQYAYNNGWLVSNGGNAEELEKYNKNQQMSDVAYHFTQEGIETFNTIDFPSAGLPKLPEGEQNYGGQEDYNGRPYYGKNYIEEGALAGNGRGLAMSPDDENAILYYSWTGKTSCPQTFKGWDPVDMGMNVTHAMSQIYYDYGNDPEKVLNGEPIGLLWEYINNSWYSDCHPNDDVGDDKNFKYLDANERLAIQLAEEELLEGFVTDAFIPVSSARFGDYISTFGPWNHLDEIHQFLGFHSSIAEPLAVYRTHANRLKRANR